MRLLHYKRCTRCSSFRHQFSFSPDRRRRDGRQSHCQSCKAAHQRDYHKRTLGSQFGLNEAEYRSLLERPCAICGATDVPIIVDHDHATGRARDALCQYCNSGLGFFRDDVSRLRAAANYVVKHTTLAVVTLALVAALAVPANAAPIVAEPDSTAACESGFPPASDYIDPACVPVAGTVLCGYRLTVDYIDFACQPWWLWPLE